MKVGFTGTQDGMTPKQYHAVEKLLKRLDKEDKLTELHHGDCIGADAHVHGIALITFSDVMIHIHPPDNDSKRDFSLGDPKRIVWYEPKPYLKRNHDIVNVTDVLIAAPKEKEEKLRSGTWATFRYGKKRNRNVYVIYPDGTEEAVEKDKICVIGNDGKEKFV